MVRSYLEDWQRELVFGRPAPPLGDVLWGGLTAVDVCDAQLSGDCLKYNDFTTAVNNLEFASREATRIVNNVAVV